MWLVITLCLIAIIGGIRAIWRPVVKSLRQHLNEDAHLGIESSYISLIRDDRYHSGDAMPVHDYEGRLIGFVRESRDG